MSERKTTEIKLRVSPDEKTSWQLAAEQREVGLSQFIRECVEESLSAQWNQGFGSLDGLALVNNAVVTTLGHVVGVTPERSVASPPEDEDSSVAPVPTSGEVGFVAKPWTFEGRNSE